nr:MAG TPA: hypothetical protein [Caudoviricetes sp.]
MQSIKKLAKSEIWGISVRLVALGEVISPQVKHLLPSVGFRV